MKIQRNPGSPRITAVRPMTEADLEALRQPSRRTDLVRGLNDSHHNVARLIAAGLRTWEIAEATGFSQTRISILRSSPAMKELVAKYRAAIDDEFIATIRKRDHFLVEATSNMAKAERMIGERLEEADETGERIPLRDLVSISSDRMDRFGYGKKTHQTNVNVGLAVKLEAAIARTKKVAAE